MAKKKKSQNTNQTKTASKITKYTCPFCHKPGAAKISLKKSDNKRSMEGLCVCTVCDAKHRVPEIRLIDTEKNVYARWEQFARMLKTSPIRCCDELTVLFIEKSPHGTIGRVECAQCEQHIFQLREGEQETNFRYRIQRELNGLEAIKAKSKNETKKKSNNNKSKSKKQQEYSESQGEYYEDELDQIQESIGDDVNKESTSEEPLFQKQILDDDEDDI
ncbi:Transcription elongation factor Ef1 like domain-containing protein [Spironucleus salmonicida]|uniref:Transcription elongation factor Ef1 like domain-containing protein n=1 Tax=Spironucleus salmonicida TaxID=348837 RepID=V6LXB5_9EUKA|nr:Transcription elongation factor Ef1 like domain-containing protein [Spironucleus salmonicida]|eukprot:EST49185.1 Transcription elongation factor Ef1 like domain-containing protein [Spironucleus salmonicida]